MTHKEYNGSALHAWKSDEMYVQTVSKVYVKSIKIWLFFLQYIVFVIFKKAD
jgi:hypothetical protein